MTDSRGRVWCHLACQVLSLVVGLGTAAAAPHIDPHIASATAEKAPKMFGDHDVEDPPPPQWVVRYVDTIAVSGGARQLPPFGRRRAPMYPQVLRHFAHHQARVVGPPLPDQPPPPPPPPPRREWHAAAVFYAAYQQQTRQFAPIS